MAKVYFSEEQRHNQWWLWAIMYIALLAVLIPFVYGMYEQKIQKGSLGNNSMSSQGLIVAGIASVLIVLIIFVVVFKARLLTKITIKGIWYSYPPLYPRGNWISPDEIARYEIKTFRTFREFGGYGVKRRRKYRQAYIIAGKTVLILYLKNGRKLLIGTQRKQALRHALEKITDNKNRY